MLLNPIIPSQSLAMLYSWRGVGKTYVALGIAYAVASGGKFLRWQATKPQRVLYVDGELPGSTLQARVAAMIAGADVAAPPENLCFLTPDLQDQPFPDLSTSKGQAQIEAHLDGVALVVIDNLSCLCRCGEENKGESWLPMQEWALTLRQRGISVLFVHHSGKGGAQRGHSRREDVLDVVIALRHSSDYRPDEGLRAEVHFEKRRSLTGEDAKPFEIRMETRPDGAAIWTMRDLENAIESKVLELLAEGNSIRDVADEMKISRSKVHSPKGRVWDSGTVKKAAGQHGKCSGTVRP
jgi:hypothetical protein